MEKYIVTQYELAPQEFIEVTNEEEVDEKLALPGSSKFRWDIRSTDILVNGFQKRKDKFLNPKCRKGVLWTEIVQEMKINGYNVDEDTLDRKMRNMKKTFKTIAERTRKGKGSTGWKYFDTFVEIFAEDPIVNGGEPNSDEDLSMELDDSNSTAPTRARSNSVFSKRGKSLNYLRQKMIRVEETKVEATKGVQELLKETNSLLRERNELLKQFLKICRPPVAQQEVKKKKKASSSTGSVYLY